MAGKAGGVRGGLRRSCPSVPAAPVRLPRISGRGRGCGCGRGADTELVVSSPRGSQTQTQAPRRGPPHRPGPPSSSGQRYGRRRAARLVPALLFPLRQETKFEAALVVGPCGYPGRARRLDRGLDLWPPVGLGRSGQARAGPGESEEGVRGCALRARGWKLEPLPRDPARPWPLWPRALGIGSVSVPGPQGRAVGLGGGGAGAAREAAPLSRAS